MVNYNEISQVYDRVRAVDGQIVECFLREMKLDETSTVLDIGCGTGNYTDVVQQVTHAQVTGLDQSPGMLDKARPKNAQIDFRHGRAEAMPFGDAVFDFVYMTDVIHHVTDLDRLFAEIARVLKPGGKTCIVTQSHAQIARRPIARFFPATVAVDQARYPDIAQIVETAAEHGLALLRAEISGAGDPAVYDQRFVEQVRSRAYSMLHLISDEEYRQGLAQVEAQIGQGDLTVSKAGKTLVWLEKSE